MPVFDSDSASFDSFEVFLIWECANWVVQPFEYEVLWVFENVRFNDLIIIILKIKWKI